MKAAPSPIVTKKRENSGDELAPAKKKKVIKATKEREKKSFPGTPQKKADETKAITVQKKSQKKLEQNESEATKSTQLDFSITQLPKRTVPQLKDFLREVGLKVGGKKSELIDRITAHLATNKKEE